MLLIGSQAAFENGVDLGRTPIDIDVICTDEEFCSIVKYIGQEDGIKLTELQTKGVKRIAKFKSGDRKLILDASIVKPIDLINPVYGSDAYLYAHRDHFGYEAYTTGVEPRTWCATNETLLMLKLSHRFKANSPHFEKTRQDILVLRKHVAGGDLDIGMYNVMKAREKLTLQPNYALNVSKSDFFTDNVPYEYDHDSLHRAVAIGEVPAYTLYQKEGSEVACCPKKFWETPNEVRINGVLEEAYVLALERAVLMYDTDPERAFNIALQKICTSITSGWFREFAWDNYPEIKSKYNPDYVDKFKSALEAGLIFKHERK